MWLVACGAPTQVADRPAREDAALLWSARLPHAAEGPRVVQRLSIPYGDSPLLAGEDTSRDGNGRAKTLIPELLSAYRRDGLAGEELVLFGPPAVWIASTTGSVPPMRRAIEGAPTRIALPLERGTASSLLFHVPRDRFRHRAEKPYSRAAESIPSRVAIVSVDVVWLGNDEAPEIVAMLAHGDSIEAQPLLPDP